LLRARDLDEVPAGVGIRVRLVRPGDATVVMLAPFSINNATTQL
jgi:hypothetical protein